MTRDEFITAVIRRTKWVEGQRWRDSDAVEKMKEMEPFLMTGPRYKELLAVRQRLDYVDFYEKAYEVTDIARHELEPLNIHIYAVSAAVLWPEEASMILSLPFDSARVLLDAGNPCALMIYPMMRLIHDDPR